jgi:hypothetical protein
MVRTLGEVYAGFEVYSWPLVRTATGLSFLPIYLPLISLVIVIRGAGPLSPDRLIGREI